MENKRTIQQSKKHSNSPNHSFGDMQSDGQRDEPYLLDTSNQPLQNSRQENIGRLRELYPRDQEERYRKTPKNAMKKKINNFAFRKKEIILKARTQMNICKIFFQKEQKELSAKYVQKSAALEQDKIEAQKLLRNADEKLLQNKEKFERITQYVYEVLQKNKEAYSFVQNDMPSPKKKAIYVAAMNRIHEEKHRTSFAYEQNHKKLEQQKTIYLLTREDVNRKQDRAKYLFAQNNIRLKREENALTVLLRQADIEQEESKYMYILNCFLSTEMKLANPYILEEALNYFVLQREKVYYENVITYTTLEKSKIDYEKILQYNELKQLEMGYDLLQQLLDNYKDKINYYNLQFAENDLYTCPKNYNIKQSIYEFSDASDKNLPVGMELKHIFHEVGHFIDYRLSHQPQSQLFKHDVFYQAAYEDFQNISMTKISEQEYVRSQASPHGALIEILKKNGVIPQDCSEMIENIFQNIITGVIDNHLMSQMISNGGMHRMDLLQESSKRHTKIVAELFAEMFCATILDWEGAKQIVHLFPNAYDVFLNILKKLLQDVLQEGIITNDQDHLYKTSKSKREKSYKQNRKIK